MLEDLNVSAIIKGYMTLRNKTQKEVAVELGMSSKTLSGDLANNTISAELLLKITKILDIDYEWMMDIISGEKEISLMDIYHTSRMNDENREKERRVVENFLDGLFEDYRYEKNAEKKLKAVKESLVKNYHNIYYLLDVLLPEDVIIKADLERGRVIYYCEEDGKSTKGNEMLSRIIAKGWEDKHEDFIL